MLSLSIRLNLLVLIGLVLWDQAAAQSFTDGPDVAAASLQAERLLQKEQWTAAEQLFDSLVQASPQSADLSLFIFGKAKAQ